MRLCTNSYIAVFKTFSTAPGTLLYEAYESFESRNPLEDEDIRNKKKELAEGVLDCINAGTFELNPIY